jgi:dTDP-glucose pyrophosphorylase
MKGPSLLLLAAGLGSRYGGFKQIDPVGPGGEIILDYSIYDARRAGFERIVIVTVPELEAPLREHLRGTLGAGLDLSFVFQSVSDLPSGITPPAGRTKPWGTGHAVWTARHVLDGPFAMINADDFYGPASFRVLCNFLAGQQPGEQAMVGFALAKTLSAHGTVSRGICQEDSRGDLVEVVEHTTIERLPEGGARSLLAEGRWAPLAGNAVTSMNMFGFDASLMPNLEIEFRKFLVENLASPKAEFFIPAVVDALIKQGKSRCKVLKTPEQWFGVTYREDREQAGAMVKALVAANIYPANLRASSLHSPTPLSLCISN